VLLILSTTVVVGLMAAALVFRERPTYRAVAAVRLTDARNAMTRGIDPDPSDRAREMNRVLSQFQLLTSRGWSGVLSTRRD
jgi:uncharacterized protein involved in exopolysaccharide biosynthesis